METTTAYSATDDTYDDDYFYTFMDEKAYVVVIDIIACIGAVGNILMFVLMFHKAFRRQSYSTYLRFLAVFDTIVIVFTVTEDSIEKLNSHETLFDTLFSEKAKCFTWTILLTFSRFVSPWILAGLSIDRCVTVMKPLQREIFSTLIKSHVYCVVVFLAAFLLQFMFIICDDETACYVEGTVCETVLSNYIAFTVYDMMVKTILPLIVIFIANMLTILRLRGVPTYEIGGYKRYNTTIALVIISVVSFIALFPKAVVEVIEIVFGECCPDKLEGESGDKINLTWHITNALMLFNFAQNFYILMFLSKLHRQGLKEIITCYKGWMQTPPDFDRVDQTEIGGIAMVDCPNEVEPLSMRKTLNNLSDLQTNAATNDKLITHK